MFFNFFDYEVLPPGSKEVHYEYKFHMIFNFKRSLLQLDFLGTQDIMNITSSKVYQDTKYVYLLD